MISFSDFTVVVQGPVHGSPNDVPEAQITANAIQSVRSLMPGAEIILSTWKGTDCSHLDYDYLIENDDPGGTYYHTSEKGKMNNNNRQIVSTRNGVLKASRKFTMKLRSDCKLTHTGFTAYLDQYNAKNNFSIFENRVLTSTVFTKDPRKIPILYHVSDIFQVGLTTDMQLLWDIPLQPEPHTTRYVADSKIIWNEPYPYDNYKMRYASEQYIWMAACSKKNIDLQLDYYAQLPCNKIVRGEKSLIANFVFLEPDKLGLELPEKMHEHLNNPTLYTFKDWENLYKRYCLKKESFVSDLCTILHVKWTAFGYVLKNFRKRKKRNKNQNA